jgi:hypothetical protein
MRALRYGNRACSFRRWRFASISGLEEMNAGEDHTEHVEERFYARRAFLLEEPPLVLREADVVPDVLSCDASAR